MYNQRFNISHQVDSPGTVQNIKCSYGHNKVLYNISEIDSYYIFQASKDVSNFYASFALAEVTTTINLLALVCHETGLTMNATVSCQINFNIILNYNDY